MFSLSRRFLRLTFVYFAATICSPPCFAQPNDLRVCADPDNLPFSNTQQQGFENRIAQLIAEDLHAQLSYVWQRMGRGFVRDFLNKGRCDVLIGIPADFRPVLTTAPYYRSTYVFVFRRDAAFKPVSLDDAGLRNVKIGVQALDEQYTPPAEALMHRGMQESMVAYRTVGADAEGIIRAVADREVNVAIVWGPLAGYWASKFGDTLECAPVHPESEPPGLPFTFEIAMGVRKGDAKLRDALDEVLRLRKNDIREILATYGVPVLKPSPVVKGLN